MLSSEKYLWLLYNQLKISSEITILKLIWFECQKTAVSEDLD